LLHLLFFLVVLVVALLLLLHVLSVLFAQTIRYTLNLARQEAKRRPQLFNEDSDLMKNASIVLNLGCEHVHFSVPFEHLVLHVGDLQA